MDAQENYLLKRFLVEVLPRGVRQRLGYTIIMSGGNACRDDWGQSKRKRFSLLILFLCLYTLGATVFILVKGAMMDRDYLGLWLAALVIALAQDLCIVKPVVIWMHFMTIQSLLWDRLYNTIDELSARVDVLKRRCMGVLKGQYMLVQHCNPVCRAARAVPHLNVARMLIALNDVDYLACEGNASSKNENRYASYWTTGFGSNLLGGIGGFWLKMFPPIAQFKVAEAIIILILDLFIILLEWLSRM